MNRHVVRGLVVLSVTLISVVGCADPLAPDERMSEQVANKATNSVDVLLADSGGIEHRARIYFNDDGARIAENFVQFAQVVTKQEAMELVANPENFRRQMVEASGGPNAWFYVKIEDAGDGIKRGWSAPFGAVGWESEIPAQALLAADSEESAPAGEPSYSATGVQQEGYAVWTSGNHTWTFNATPCFDAATVVGDTNFVSAAGTIRLRDEGTTVDTETGIGPGAESYGLSDSNNASDEWSIRSSCTSSCGSFNHAGQFTCID